MIRKLPLLLIFCLSACDYASKNDPEKEVDVTPDFETRYYQCPPSYFNLLIRKGGVLRPEGGVVWCPKVSGLLADSGFKFKKGFASAYYPGGGYLLLKADQTGHDDLLKLHRKLGISIHRIPIPDKPNLEGLSFPLATDAFRNELIPVIDFEGVPLAEALAFIQDFCDSNDNIPDQFRIIYVPNPDAHPDFHPLITLNTFDSLGPFAPFSNTTSTSPPKPITMHIDNISVSNALSYVMRFGDCSNETINDEMFVFSAPGTFQALKEHTYPLLPQVIDHHDLPNDPLALRHRLEEWGIMFYEGGYARIDQEVPALIIKTTARMHVLLNEMFTLDTSAPVRLELRN